MDRPSSRACRCAPHEVKLFRILPPVAKGCPIYGTRVSHAWDTAVPPMGHGVTTYGVSRKEASCGHRSPLFLAVAFAVLCHFRHKTYTFLAICHRNCHPCYHQRIKPLHYIGGSFAVFLGKTGSASIWVVISLLE